MIDDRKFRLTIDGQQTDPSRWDLGDAELVLVRRSDYDFLKMLAVGEFMTDSEGDMWERVE